MVVPLFKLFNSSYELESTDDESDSLTCEKCKYERSDVRVDVDSNRDGCSSVSDVCDRVDGIAISCDTPTTT